MTTSDSYYRKRPKTKDHKTVDCKINQYTEECSRCRHKLDNVGTFDDFANDTLHGKSIYCAKRKLTMSVADLMKSPIFCDYGRY